MWGWRFGSRTNSYYSEGGKAGYMGKGLALICKGEVKHMLSTKAGKSVSTESQFDMEKKLNLITKHATEDEKFKFSSLAGVS